MTKEGTTIAPSRMKIATAFAAVYLIWGSTYLAIRFGIETIPPLFMAGVRFLIAGSMLYAWTRLRGTAKPTLRHWKSASIVGLLLLLVGNGSVVWAEQVVPSGITALLVAGSPLWFVILEWIQRGIKPTLNVVLGLILGTLGLVVLVDPAKLVAGEQVNLVGASLLVVASISWAAGSLYSRKAHLPTSPLLATGMEMLAGGAALILAGLISGEASRLHLSTVSMRSTVALGYLVAFGSLVGFTSYIWLLRVTTPALVSTYAYVNPVVAVFLGWLLADETINARILLAAAIIVAAVALITTASVRRSFKSLKNLKADGIIKDRAETSAPLRPLAAQGEE